MITRTETEVQQLATLLLQTVQTAPALKQPAKAMAKAGLHMAWKLICKRPEQEQEAYREIMAELPVGQYTAQSRAIAVLAVDWLHGDNSTDWEQLITILTTDKAK